MDAKEALADCLHTLSVLEEDWYLSSGPYGESADPEANAEMKKSVDKLRSMLIERDALKAELAAARPLLDAAMAFNGKVDEKTGIIHGSISREDEDALNTYCETMLHAYFTRRRNDGLEKAETEADKDYAAIAHLRAALALRGEK